MTLPFRPREPAAGQGSPRRQGRLRRWARRGAIAGTAAVVGAAALLLLLDRLHPFPTARLHRPPSVAVLDHEGEPLRLFLAADDRWRLPVTREELPPELIEALIASEDRWFRHHPGINPLAIARAAGQNLRAGRVVSGGSTLTMQIARMATPAERTLGAKLREAARALQLERMYDKEELLRIYLDLAPFGGNLEGVGAAAYFYFGKRPAELSIGEIALLVTLPRSPTLYDPTRDREAARRARDRVLAQLAVRGTITAREAAEATRQPVPSRRRPAPFAAPHFTRWAARRAGVPRVETTLDRRFQARAEAQVRRRLAELRPQGIGNAAAVVLERSGRQVRAMVGSGGFFEREFAGQNNGVLARRSPGSTLKPFLYALALDRGEVVADSWLFDLPTDFAGYVAENYDGRYQGRVTVREALTRSLNAPAVRLLARLGVGDYLELLRHGGLLTLDRPAGEYGLPLVLGAGEVTLLDLTNLYATLAEGGEHRFYRLFADSRPRPAPQTPGRELRPVRLFSPEAAWTVTEILQEVRRPDLPSAWRLAADVPAVAWKTGTSYGHRDAWAVGFSGRFAIGVWVGNFDGTPRHGISGSEHAAPLLFDLFRALEAGGSGLSRPSGLRLETIEVCAESHQLVGPDCPQATRVEYLPGRSRLGTCSFHRRIRLAAGAGETWRVATVYPAELVSWWRQEGRSLPEEGGSAGSTLAARQGIRTGAAPRIVSPDAATPYRLRSDAPAEFQKIALTARVAADAERLFWYQDGLLVASGPPGETWFLTPTRGHHRLVVSDDRGRTDALTFQVY